MRYFPSNAKIKEIVKAGLIGKVVGLNAFSVYDKPKSYWSGGYSGSSKNNWRTKISTSGGGTFLMNMFHTLDYWLNITDLKPKEAFSQYDTFATDVEVEDYIAAIVRFKNGAIGNFVASSMVRGFWDKQPDVILRFNSR